MYLSSVGFSIYPGTDPSGVTGSAPDRVSVTSLHRKRRDRASLGGGLGRPMRRSGERWRVVTDLARLVVQRPVCS